jgi:uncharacterized protein (TIGR03435 family)
MTMHAGFAGMAVLLAAGAGFAQTADTRPAYEAASVKVNNSGSGNSSSNGSKGQVMMSNQTLKRLIERAYDAKPYQIFGPSWLEEAHFDLAAKYPPDTKNEDRVLMMRTLLEDRFKLVVHHETRELQGYVLVVAKGGFKLKPVEGAGGSSTSSSGGRVRTLTVKNTSIPFLAELLARYLGEVVVDKSGIEGAYDFEFKWTPEDLAANSTDADSAPSLFTAVQETLGLKLQPQKVPVDVIVIDHAERVPIEN